MVAILSSEPFSVLTQWIYLTVGAFFFLFVRLVCCRSVINKTLWVTTQARGEGREFSKFQKENGEMNELSVK